MTDAAPRQTWVRHATDDADEPGPPDLVADIAHYDNRVSAPHPEDRSRHLALLAARASQCAAVEGLDAADHHE